LIVAHRARVATLAMSRAPSSPSRVALSRRDPKAAAARSTATTRQRARAREARHRARDAED